MRPQSSSAHNAVNAIRRSPGGKIGNSSRNRPLDPPLSATVTIAVISWVIWRNAARVAAKPWPPPSATTLDKLIHDQHLDELDEPTIQYQPHSTAWRSLR